MKMEKNKVRIGQLAERLEVEKFVIRFWEKEFNIKSTRSRGGQRFYYEQDLSTFKLIKDLLYNRGFTIAGAKKFIHKVKLATHQDLSSYKTASCLFTCSSSDKPEADNNNLNLNNQIALLHKKLVKLRELL